SCARRRTPGWHAARGRAGGTLTGHGYRQQARRLRPDGLGSHGAGARRHRLARGQGASNPEVLGRQHPGTGAQPLHPGRALAPPEQEARLRGRRHSPARDAAAVTHHYDVGNDFYRLVLGPSLTYSCAYFATSETTLEEAQEAKYELIATKLALAPGMRLLDV